MHIQFFSRNVLLRRGRLVAAVLAVAATVAVSHQVTQADPPSGAPVITSFQLVETTTGWVATGSVASSEGLEGLNLYFREFMHEDEAPDANGNFTVGVDGEPMEGDWVELHAEDRYGTPSVTETRYFD